MNKMAPAVSTLLFLSCAVIATVVRADVSHLGYNRFGRIQATRLESGPTPYPASGYRPNRQFSLPREQPLFPVNNQQPQNNKQFSNGFDNLGETQRPELTYGAPQAQQPLNNNGFNNLAEPQSPELTYGAPGQEQSRFPVINQQPQAQQPQNNNGFNNLAEPQSPELTYGAPARLSQLQAAKLRQLLSARLQQQQLEPQQFYSTAQNTELSNLAESQRPKLTYNSPARLRQPQPARLQQQQQPQQFYAAPQRLLEVQAERFSVQKPARLTDNREDKDDEEDDDKTADATADIETNNKKDDEKKVVAPQNIAYYPAGAFTFVQPANAAYVAAGLQTLQPVSAAYTLGSPFLQQRYTFANPAQLQAW